MNFSGGTDFAILRGFTTSHFNVSGGSVNGAVEGFDASTFNITGGAFTKYLEADASSTFNFYGSGLSSTQVLVSSRSGYLQYSLFGTLTSGASLNGTTLYTNTSGTPTISFVNAVSTPEPGVYALLAALGVPGVLALRRRRTRKRNLPFRRNYYGPQHLSLCAEEASPNAVFAPPGRHSS